jgi:hypothetical protein
MKLIVAGSRSVTDYSLVASAIDELVRKGMKISAIIDGTARGVDTLAARYATDHGIENIRVPADWKQFGPGAGRIRNIRMAEMGDALLALWDGKSSGTRTMIEAATKRGIQVHVVYCE